MREPFFVAPIVSNDLGCMSVSHTHSWISLSTSNDARSYTFRSSGAWYIEFTVLSVGHLQMKCALFDSGDYVLISMWKVAAHD
jgi:hypothetical protein